MRLCVREGEDWHKNWEALGRQMGLGDIIYEVRVGRGDPRTRTLLHLEIWKDRGYRKTEFYVIPGFPLFISLARPFIDIWMVNITSCGARLAQVRVLSSVQSLSRVRLFATPWTVAYQAPLSVGFSRQECWRGLPFPSPARLLTSLQLTSFLSCLVFLSLLHPSPAVSFLLVFLSFFLLSSLPFESRDSSTYFHKVLWKLKVKIHVNGSTPST